MTDYAQYFDNNATTPVSVVARDAWLRATAEHWQNPSSLYRGAGMTRRLLEEARGELADYFDEEECSVVFTSGATEANNAVMEYAARVRATGGLVVISAVEHPSVREAAIKSFGYDRVRELAVDDRGLVGLSDLQQMLEKEEVALVSVMAANNETGVIQPWRQIAGLCRKQGVLYHCDAAQWIGKMELQDLGGCDFVSGSGHKFGGPKGVGFLCLGATVEEGFRSQVGGPQEGGRRAGTEDYPGVAAMMAALRERQAEWSVERSEQRLQDREAFERLMVESLPGVQVVAQDAGRLWNTVMLILPAAGPKNLKWLIRLDRLGFAVSTGSACSAGKGNPSHVMQAMGLDFDQMSRVLRISGGWETREGDWMALADALGRVWEDLKSGGRMGNRRQEFLTTDSTAEFSETAGEK
ncbi:MAG: cysteine desulfurase [Verrucomicrobiales bacterium]|nr:cysteine desulfurase [Verrucomicrobiales bacterium]